MICPSTIPTMREGSRIIERGRLARMPLLASRESWLQGAAGILSSWIDSTESEGTYPSNVRYACGFPIGSHGKKGCGDVIGQAWSRTVSTDGAAETFISPVLDEPTRVLDVLLHEMAHHALGIPEGHGKKFGALVRELGMIGPKTATTSSHLLRERFRDEVMPFIGRYPHGAMGTTTYTTPSGRKKTVPSGMAPVPSGGTSKNSLLKVWCLDECGFTVRASNRWVGIMSEAPCPNCGGDLTHE
jgi:hypothetical protein